MFNVEFLMLIVEIARGNVNLASYLASQEQSEKKSKAVLRFAHLLVEAYSALRSSVLLLKDMAELLSQPSLSSLTFLSLAPPPVLLLCYSLTALYQLYKITEQLLKLADRNTTAEQKQQCLIEIGHSALVLTAAAAMMVSTVMAPGLVNIVALSCLCGAAAFKGLSYLTQQQQQADGDKTQQHINLSIEESFQAHACEKAPPRPINSCSAALKESHLSVEQIVKNLPPHHLGPDEKSLHRNHASKTDGLK